jgi:hypothetical protein
VYVYLIVVEILHLQPAARQPDSTPILIPHLDETHFVLHEINQLLVSQIHDRHRTGHVEMISVPPAEHPVLMTHERWLEEYVRRRQLSSDTPVVLMVAGLSLIAVCLPVAIQILSITDRQYVWHQVKILMIVFVLTP